MRFFAFILLLLHPLISLGDLSKFDFKYGDRPSDSVFDPTGVLTSSQRNEISKPLLNVLREEGIDVMVIVLPDLGEAPPLHVARGFDERWSKTEISSVVLHVPGNPDSPWIFPGEALAKVIKPEVLDNSVKAARMRAAAEPIDASKIRAASIEAADLMRYWTGGAILRTESIIREMEIQRADFEKRRRLLKLAVILGAAGTIPVIGGLVFFISRYKQRGPKEFPPVRKMTRLGAPYAGGNNSISRIK